MIPTSISRANLTAQKVTGHCTRAGSCSPSTRCSCKEQPDQLQMLLRARGDYADLVLLGTASGWLEQELCLQGEGLGRVCTYLSFHLLPPLWVICLFLSRFQLHHSFLGNPSLDTGLLQVMLYLALRYCNLPTCYFDLRSQF